MIAPATARGDRGGHGRCFSRFSPRADLASKRWAFDTVGSEPVVLEREHLVGDPAFDPVGWGPRRALLPGDLLDLTLVLNPGAVFGIAANQRKFFIAFTLAALAAGVGVFAWYTTRRAWSGS